MAAKRGCEFEKREVSSRKIHSEVLSIYIKKKKKKKGQSGRVLGRRNVYACPVL